MKIAVIGYSGSGKSTLAARLGEHYALPVLHIDKVQWLPGWQTNTPENKLHAMREFLDSNDGWVIDGNYSKLFWDERMESADRIIFMNFGRIDCLLRAYRRYRTYRGQTRFSMTEGCEEKFDAEFMLWILRDGRKKKTRQKFSAIVQKYPEKVTVIRNQRQLDRFYTNLRK